MSNSILLGVISFLVGLVLYLGVLYFLDRKKVKIYKDKTLYDLESMLISTLGGDKREDQAQSSCDNDTYDFVSMFDDLPVCSDSEPLSERKSD